MKVIEIENLTKKYGRNTAIENVSFQVEDGEIFGFIGPNGAGKSTTIRTLLSIIYPTSGKAKIFGKDSIRHAAEIKQDIGYLPSEVFYYEKMKVKDLLAYSASFYRKDCRKRIKELAEIMQLDLSKRIGDLSFGNRKKAGIIQALLHEPKLIILDEPTGGLDPLMQQTFFQLLKEENRKGATILLSSHILSEVERLCSRVAIIKEGKIAAVEQIKELQEKKHKIIRIEFNQPIDENMLMIAGVNQLTIDGKTANFLYKGDINSLIKVLSACDLRNIWIDEPDLEEIFLHYYQKGSEKS
ncbi:ABC transporter [Bacillus sp. FJAT-27916]|uniref:ABC transporter ATP-binding protein n=1 Tax=Bacillaceae TaxID=186817 RepID=UPI000670C308|nr:ABC transporter ATP-binding protein [Bacillus sp. FJAT-27916]KMY45686.1 ABC transporter [Bacillus sp. FJAT-27916]